MTEKLVRLEIEDLAGIMNLENICFPDDPWTKSDWIDLLNDERAIYLGQLEGGEIVSNIFLYNWAGEKDFLKIMNLSVHPDYRGEQRAHLLLTESIKFAEKNNLKRILAETRESNLKMRAIFEHLGFEIINKVEDYYQNPDEMAIKYSYEII